MFEYQRAEYIVRSEILALFGNVELPFQQYLVTISCDDYIQIKTVGETLCLYRYSQEYNNVISELMKKLHTFKTEQKLIGVTNV